MKKIICEIIFICIFIIVIQNKVYAVPTGTYDPSWETEEVELDQLPEILEGVNTLAQEASAGSEDAAQELRYKMAMLNLFWEKYLFFGDYVRNIPEAMSAKNNNWSVDPWQSGHSLSVKRIQMPNGKVLRNYYRYIDNEYATRYVQPVFTSNGKVSEEREKGGGYTPSYCCWHWAMAVRPWIQTGEETPLAGINNGSKIGDIIKEQEYIKTYYSVEDILADGYYSGIFLYAGNHSHAYYVEAIVYDGTDGYIYTSETGSGFSSGYAAHYEGVIKRDISFLLNSNPTVGGCFFVVTGRRII